jgi:hypothetical protein
MEQVAQIRSWITADNVNNGRPIARPEQKE